MTKEEKFYNEVSKHDPFFKYGHFGFEEDGKVIFFVHEDRDDNCDKYVYPSMEELSKDDDMREKIFNEVDCIEDLTDEELGRLYRWKVFGKKYKENPFPVDEVGLYPVYYACSPDKELSVRYEDDEEFSVYIDIVKKEEMTMSATTMDEVMEKVDGLRKELTEKYEGADIKIMVSNR